MFLLANSPRRGLVQIKKKEGAKFMVTDSDHIEALRRRLLERQREKENELVEIREMIRVLGDAPKVLSGKPTSQERSSGKIGKPINTNLSKNVDDYLASYPFDQAVNIGAMIKALKSDYGVSGKDSSLYAYIHSLLKKKTSSGHLSYDKGVGFYKKRDSDKRDSTLVAQA